MQVRVEVEFDDRTLVVTREDRLYSASSNRAGGAVLFLGYAMGKVLAALAAGSDIPINVMVEEFHEAVIRESRPASVTHTCDGVGCC